MKNEKFHRNMIAIGLIGLFLLISGNLRLFSNNLTFLKVEHYQIISFFGLVTGGVVLGYYLVGYRFPKIKIPALRSDTDVQEILELRKVTEESSDNPYAKYHYFEEVTLEEATEKLGLGKRKWIIGGIGILVTVIILGAAGLITDLNLQETFLTICLILLGLVGLLFLAWLIWLAVKNHLEEEFTKLFTSTGVLVSIIAFIFFGGFGFNQGWLSIEGLLCGLVIILPFFLIGQLEGRFLPMFFIHQCFQLLNWDFLEGSAIHKKDKPLKQRLKGWAKWILAGAALVSIPIGFISIFSNFMKILFTSNPLTDTGFPL